MPLGEHEVLSLTFCLLRRQKMATSHFFFFLATIETQSDLAGRVLSVVSAEETDHHGSCDWMTRLFAVQQKKKRHSERYGLYPAQMWRPSLWPIKKEKKKHCRISKPYNKHDYSARQKTSLCNNCVFCGSIGECVYVCVCVFTYWVTPSEVGSNLICPPLWPWEVVRRR